MAFNAGEVLPDLDWDFTKFGQGSGTTPEPSARQLRVYRKEFQSLMTAARGSLANEVEARIKAVERGEVPDVISLDQALADMGQFSGDEPVVEAMEDTLCEMVAKVCSNTPSKEQLLGLPMRIRLAFFGWLNGQLLDPNFVPTVTSRSLELVKNTA
jgi:hypothetical protein